jgi:hypothetical protein
MAFPFAVSISGSEPAIDFDSDFDFDCDTASDETLQAACLRPVPGQSHIFMETNTDCFPACNCCVCRGQTV